MLISTFAATGFLRLLTRTVKRPTVIIEGRFRQPYNFAYLGADEINVALKVSFEVRFVTSCLSALQ